MTQHNRPTQLQDALLAPGPRHMEKAIGCVSVFVAAALAAFDLFLLTAIVRGEAKLLVLDLKLRASAAAQLR